MLAGGSADSLMIMPEEGFATIAEHAKTVA